MNNYPVQLSNSLNVQRRLRLDLFNTRTIDDWNVKFPFRDFKVKKKKKKWKIVRYNEVHELLFFTYEKSFKSLKIHCFDMHLFEIFNEIKLQIYNEIGIIIS